MGSIPGSGRSPEAGNSNPLLLENPLDRGAWRVTVNPLLPGKSPRQRSQMGYSPWGHKELDMTKATEI